MVCCGLPGWLFLHEYGSHVPRTFQGISPGIGAGICKVFCEAGATVALWDIIDGQDTVDELSKEGHNIFYQKVDILLIPKDKI